MAPYDSDDDVDDLDDILNNFKPSTTTTTKPTDASSSSAKAPSQAQTTTQTQSTASDDLTDDAFARELEQGMKSLMQDLGSPGAVPGDAAEQQKAMQSAWEALFRESMDAAAAAETTGPTGTSATGSAAAPGAKGAGGGDSFQRSIRETMERMKSSEQSMKDSTAAGTGTDPGQDDIAALLAALQGGGGENSEGDDAELGSFLESMMDQLMSKEVLYEPLKELYDKFPEYLASHPPESSTPSPSLDPSKKLTPIPASDHARYVAQQRLITTVITKFDDPKYDDTAKTAEAEKSRKEIVDLMSELQSLGTPPDELMGPLPAGLGLGGEGMPEGCSIM